MGANPRVVPEDGDMEQADQEAELVRTSNAATVENQDALLEAMFGPADADGFYGKPEGE